MGDGGAGGDGGTADLSGYDVDWGLGELGLSGDTGYSDIAGEMEATAFGSRAIVERLVSSGVEIRQIVAMGGIAHKSPFIMQVSADVMNMPIKVVKSEQTCALGAAMFAAVASGLHPNLKAAQEKMAGGFSRTYTPIPENVARYEQLYQNYLKLGETIADQLRAL